MAEVGSAWVRRMVARPVQHVIYTAALTEVEVRRALSAVRSSTAERRGAKPEAPLTPSGTPGDVRQEKETTPWDK